MSTQEPIRVIAMSGCSDPNADRRLDTRDIDGEPFGAIMSELDELQDCERLLLVNSFEPEPLYEVLEQRGFESETSQVEDDEWHVVIEHAE